jgi:hypothetical protein
MYDEGAKRMSGREGDAVAGAPVIEAFVAVIRLRARAKDLVCGEGVHFPRCVAHLRRHGRDAVLRRVPLVASGHDHVLAATADQLLSDVVRAPATAPR